MAPSPSKGKAHKQGAPGHSRGVSPYVYLGIGAVAIVAIALAITLLSQANRPGEEAPLMTAQFRNAHSWLGTSMDSNPNGDGIPYTTDPPTHGPHTTYLARWGVYKEAVPRAVLVHNMEDGGVIIWYNPSLLSLMGLKLLTDIVEGYPQHVVLTPYPSLSTPVAVTAWGRILRLTAMDTGKVFDFINAYKGIDHHVAAQG
ncbi:MAG: DUF3105 domain-containing protein [Chloroflexota bacterium]